MQSLTWACVRVVSLGQWSQGSRRGFEKTETGKERKPKQVSNWAGWCCGQLELSFAEDSQENCAECILEFSTWEVRMSVFITGYHLPFMKKELIQGTSTCTFQVCTCTRMAELVLSCVPQEVEKTMLIQKTRVIWSNKGKALSRRTCVLPFATSWIKRWAIDRHVKRCSTSLLEKCKSKLKRGTTSHKSKWPSPKSLQIINAGEGVELREPSCTVGGNVNWYSHYENSMEIP